MPIFEYACRKCGKVFEKLILKQGQGPHVCPRCGSRKVERQFSTFSTSASSPNPSRACAPSGAG